MLSLPISPSCCRCHAYADIRRLAADALCARVLDASRAASASRRSVALCRPIVADAAVFACHLFIDFLLTYHACTLCLRLRRLRRPSPPTFCLPAQFVCFSCCHAAFMFLRLRRLFALRHIFRSMDMPLARGFDTTTLSLEMPATCC